MTTRLKILRNHEEPKGTLRNLNKLQNLKKPMEIFKNQRILKEPCKNIMNHKEPLGNIRSHEEPKGTLRNLNKSQNLKKPMEI